MKFRIVNFFAKKKGKNEEIAAKRFGARLLCPKKAFENLRLAISDNSFDEIKRNFEFIKNQKDLQIKFEAERIAKEFVQKKVEEYILKSKFENARECNEIAKLFNDATLYRENVNKIFKAKKLLKEISAS